MSEKSGYPINEQVLIYSLLDGAIKSKSIASVHLLETINEHRIRFRAPFDSLVQTEIDDDLAFVIQLTVPRFLSHIKPEEIETRAIRIYFTHLKQIYYFNSTILKVKPFSPGMMITVSFPGIMYERRRRVYSRVAVPKSTADIRLINISLAGFLLESDRDITFRPGGKCQFLFQIPIVNDKRIVEPQDIELIAQVKWIEKSSPTKVGFEFVDLADQFLSIIQKYMNQLQNAAMLRREIGIDADQLVVRVNKIQLL